MKKLTITIVVLLLLAMAVIPVAAKGGGNGGSSGTQQQSPRGTFAITGKIFAIDTVNRTVTVQVLRGNKLGLPYFNQNLLITTTLKTRFLYKASTTSTATMITFEQLKIGDPISVNGIVANTIWTATRITVGASLSCHNILLVVAYARIRTSEIISRRFCLANSRDGEALQEITCRVLS